MKDMKEAIAKSRKVAVYASLGEHVWYPIFEVTYRRRDERYQPLPDGQLRELPIENFVRVSEPVEINFTAASDNSVVQLAIESLNAAERKAIDELNTKITAIREQKAQLLALTHQTEQP